MNKSLLWLVTLIVLLIIPACSGTGEDFGDMLTVSPSPSEQTQAQEPTGTSQPTVTEKPSPTDLPSPTPVVALTPEPLEILFTASDGQELDGLYFPAAERPAPIIVLMTWSRGNQTEWEEVAYWLQDRGLLVRTLNSRETWKSSNWYPEITLGRPVGVFTFNFRACEEQSGCQSYLPAEWLLDAQAALETASKLEGVDSDKILAVGASNGADGAVDSCAWLNSTGLGKCRGAFALSPASSLTVDFRTAAQALLAQDPPAVVYCLYGLQDDASQETCGDFAEIVTIDYGYVDDHGLELILVDRRPDPLNVLQDFINEALGGADE